jgi:putative transcriptional regulator
MAWLQTVCGACLALAVVGTAAAAEPRLPPKVAPQVAPAPGMFLIARRELRDPNFYHAVVLLTQHGPHGSMGLIVNRRTGMRLAEVLPDLEAPAGTDHALYIGGPVARGRIVMLMRREKPGEDIVQVSDDILFSAERTVLDALLARRKPANELRLYAGHAGWGPGQLGLELARRDWHVVKADSESIFGGGEDQLWERLIRKIEPTGLIVRSEPAERAPAPRVAVMPLGRRL